MYRIALASIAALVCLQVATAELYKGPSALIANKDGTIIYVVNRDAHEIAVLNTANDTIVRTIALDDGFYPNNAVLNADETILYVTGGAHRGRVLAINLATGNVVNSVAAGHTPMGAVITPDGTKLFVCNRFTNDVFEYSLPDLTLTRVIRAIREPHVMVVTNDGKYVLVANSIPLMPNNYYDPECWSIDPGIDIYVASEITVIEVATGETKTISNLPNGSGALLGMCISPDGRYVYITAIIARFLLPTTHVERGWMNTAGIIIIDTTKLDDECSGYVNTVLLDDVDRGAANPWGITTSADGNRIFVAIAGTAELMVIDAVALHNRLAAFEERRAVNPNITALENDLAFLAGTKTRLRMPGQGARAVTVAGNHVYVGMYFSDTLQKFNQAQLRPTVRPVEIALGPTPVWTPERRGEIWWNDARLCFQWWQSCASCHPDARMDGYNWDLLNDGMGNPKNVKSLLYSPFTPPSMWERNRDNPERNGWDTATMGVECVRTGFRFIHFIEHPEETSRDIDAYLRALKPEPSPFLMPDGSLSERALRGRVVFNAVGCAVCHPSETWYTDMKEHDVNSRAHFTRTSYLDTPTLHEVWRTAPYMHDGRYVNMRDVFALGRHGDTMGDVGGLTDEQIDDLVEFILSL